MSYLLALAIPSEPPLDPGADEARGLLERELSAPRYQPGLLERVRDWLDDLLSRGPDSANPLALVARPALLVLLVLLVLAVVWLLVRLRRDPRPDPAGAVFDDVRLRAVEHRARARTAFADEQWDRAVVEGVRAISAGLVERSVVEDSLASTAREVATSAAPRFPSLAERLDRAARSFEETRYGGRAAGRAAAQAVLDLDHELSSAAPVDRVHAGPVSAVPR